MQSPRGGHRQARDIADNRPQPAMPQPFLHAGESCLVVPRFDEDHPAGRQSGLFQPRREKILKRHAPEHLPGGAGGDPGGEAGGRRAVHRTVSASGDFMQAAERQPATGQLAVQRHNPERQHLVRTRTIAFEPRDARPQLGHGWAVCTLGHMKMASPGLCTGRFRCYVPYLFPCVSGVNLGHPRSDRRRAMSYGGIEYSQGEWRGMCNLYRITTNQQAIRDFVAATHDSIGNLEPSIDVYPDRPAPVVRNIDGARELASLTWGMPTPIEYLKSRDAPDTGVTNIRNTGSPHWRKWLGVEHRCVVPASAFSEYGQKHDPVTKRKPLHWFALDETQPLFFFAGIWTPWRGTRGSNRTPRAGDHQLFAFLTTEPNGVVRPIHPKAMPVILTSLDEVETWLTADWKEAKALQRPLPDERLVILETSDSAAATGMLPGI